MRLANMKRERGFTLLELMIVVAIVGILAAIALPQYRQYIIKGNRAAAQSFLMEVANRQKQYLLDARTYAADLTTLGLNPPPSEVGRNYTISICLDSAGAACATPSSPPYFNITATPIAGKPQESDGSLTLDDVGIKTPAAKW